MVGGYIMNKVDGVILEGEKLGLEKYSGRDNKMMVDLHILNGFESVKLRVRDNNLIKQLEEVPNRKPLKVKAEVGVYNGNMYLIAKGIAQ